MLRTKAASILRRKIDRGIAEIDVPGGIYFQERIGEHVYIVQIIPKRGISLPCSGGIHASRHRERKTRGGLIGPECHQDWPSRRHRGDRRRNREQKRDPA